MRRTHFLKGRNKIETPLPDMTPILKMVNNTITDLMTCHSDNACVDLDGFLKIIISRRKVLCLDIAKHLQ